MNPLNQIMEKALRRAAYTADDLIRRIKDFQVISFDLFDTLMYRRTVTPQEIFRQTALDFNRENAPESIEAASFVQDRMSAVEEAFRRAARNGWEEITFEEIYACLPEKYRSVSARLMELEKREELRSAMPNPVLQQIQQGALFFVEEIRQWFPEIELSGGDAVENLRVIGKKPTKKTLSLLSDISCWAQA